MKAFRIPVLVLCCVLGGALMGGARAQAAVVFADTNLEAAVRAALGKTNGIIAIPDLAAMTVLSAPRANIADLTGLEWAVNLQLLDIAGNSVSELSPLGGLLQLTELNASDNQILDCGSLSGNANLVHLWLSGNPVTSLDALTNLAGLESLFAYHCRIKDVSPLTRLTNLGCVDVRWNLITNAPVLSACTNLARLYLGGNSVSNLGFLEPLTRLTVLDVGQVGVRDLSVLAGLTNLAYVVLSGNLGITNYPVLETLKGLAGLELRANSVSNLSFFAGLKQLHYADLAFNNLTDLSDLTLLTNLSAVDLSGNPNTNYVPGVTGRSNLWLFHMSISNIAFLSGMPQLTALGLDDNLVNDLSPLSGLTQLRHLGLSRNPIADYGVVSGLTNLTRLWVEGNTCSNLGFVQGLASLRALSVRDNRLVNLAALEGLTNLSTVYAAQNRLTNIAALADLPNLTRVELWGNLLDLSEGSPGLAAVRSLQSRGVQVDYLPTNRPPILALPPAWYIPANQTSSLSFHVSDALVASDELTVTADSMDAVLLPGSGIALAGADSDRMLTVTPAAGQTGSTLITLMAGQPPGGLSVSSNIVVTILNPTNVILHTNLAEAISEILNRPATGLTSVDLLALTSLYVYGVDIDTVSGLERASNLAILDLSGNRVADAAPLQFLTRLSSVNLAHNFVADATPLAQLAGLTFLDLSWNPVTNSLSLSVLSNLVTLRLAGDSVTNLHFLTNFPRLAELDLSFNAISDISPLAGLTNLVSLSLRQNRLTNVALLAGLPKLSYVDLSLNLLEPGDIDIIEGEGVEVNFDPQRTAPLIDVRTNWLVPLQANSALAFDVWDTGPPNQQYRVGASVAGAGLGLQLTPVAGAGGSGHWMLNVTNSSATGASWWITLRATNDVGIATNVLVRVEAAALMPAGGEWLGNTNLVWTGGGSAPWFGQALVSQDGYPAVQSGALANNQVSALETMVEGPGRLSFWWKVSSEEQYDWLQFSVADFTLRISGELGWRRQVANVPPGIQTLNWSYSKDQAGSAGQDAAWLARVEFTPGIWLEHSGVVTNAQRELLLHGVPGSVYEVQVSTNLAGWSYLTFVISTNVSMPFLTVNSSSGSRFYRLHEILPGSIRLEGRVLTNGWFELTVHSPPNLPLNIQTCASPPGWTSLTTITNFTGTTTFVDTQATALAARYYRVMLLP